MYRTYGPKYGVVFYQHSNDIDRPLRHLNFSQRRCRFIATIEKQIGRHYHSNIIQVHLVFLSFCNDMAQKQQQELKIENTTLKDNDNKMFYCLKAGL